MEAKLVGIEQAAVALGVSKDTVRRLIAKQELKAVRISRRILVPVAEINKIIMEGLGPAKSAKATRAQ